MPTRLDLNPKHEIRSPKQFRINNTPMNKTPRFDLEDRTFAFSRDVRSFVRALPRTLSNESDLSQLVRSSGSVGANYIEANEALSKKDFALRVKICRKEAKESRYWLRLIEVGVNANLSKQRDALLQEATELTSIFGAIVRKCV